MTDAWSDLDLPDHTEGKDERLSTFGILYAVFCICIGASATFFG